MNSLARLALLFSGFNLALTWAAAADAPTAGSAPGESREQRMLSFLPADQQTEVMDAYKKAIADHPDLQAEENDLRTNHPDFETATEEDRMAFMEKIRAHQEKIRAAMLKEDPKIDPILTKIDEHRKEMRQQHQAASSGTTPSGGTSSRPQ